jgi:hypothetical protein
VQEWLPTAPHPIEGIASSVQQLAGFRIPEANAKICNRSQQSNPQLPLYSLYQPVQSGNSRRILVQEWLPTTQHPSEGIASFVQELAGFRIPGASAKTCNRSKQSNPLVQMCSLYPRVQSCNSRRILVQEWLPTTQHPSEGIASSVQELAGFDIPGASAKTCNR